MKKIVTLIICLAIPLTVGWISGSAPSGYENEWYQSLQKPSFNPPGYLFGIVWSILYLLMGISLFLIWQSPPSSQRNKALTLFAVQLVLNFAWSFIFFSFEEAGWALIEIIILLGIIVAMIMAFKKVNTIAAWLQVPYLIWVCFATVLNATIWWLNR